MTGKAAKFGVAVAMAAVALLSTGGIALADDNPPPSVPCEFNHGTCKGAKGPIASEGLCEAEFYGIYVPTKQTAAGYACVEYPKGSGNWYLYTDPGRGHIPPGGARSLG